MKIPVNSLLVLCLSLVGCNTTPELASKGPDALSNAAQREMANGNYLLAERRIDALAILGDDQGNPKISGDAVFLRAQLTKKQKDVERAMSLLDMAQSLYAEADYKMGLAVVHAERGQLLASQYKDDQACKEFSQALSIYKEARIDEKETDDIPTSGRFGNFEETVSSFMNELKCNG